MAVPTIVHGGVARRCPGAAYRRVQQEAARSEHDQGAALTPGLF
jgi:hypothetical protein